LFNLLFLPVIWVAMREGYAGVAFALVTIQLTLAVVTAFVGYNTTDFAILQLLMLVLSITGLLLGAVTTERQDAGHASHDGLSEGSALDQSLILEDRSLVRRWRIGHARW